jgi:hypothetical protein
MTSRSKASVWVLAALAALWIAGCAKPPLEEQKAAQAARDQAMASKAEQYAVSSMNAAVQAMTQAEEKMTQKAYAEAQTGFVAAKTAFEKAASEVEAGRQAMIAENQVALQTLDKGWADLQKAVKKRMKNMTKETKEFWNADTKVITAALEKAKDVATDPAELKKALAEANQAVERWLAGFTQK